MDRRPSNVKLAEPRRLGIVSQVLDVRTRADFALVAGRHGSFRLRRTHLSDGKVRLGPSFPVSSIGFGSGSVWIFGERPLGHVGGRHVAPSPSGRYLYVATSDRYGRSPVLEYTTARGRMIAMNTKTVIAVAEGGGTLTAAPCGVWVSFRTGMEGLTVLLRQGTLRMVRLPGSGQPDSLFAWAMWAGTEYTGTSLYLARADGTAACLSPRTGQPRTRGTAAGRVEIDRLLGARRAGGCCMPCHPPGSSPSPRLCAAAGEGSSADQ